MKRILIIGFYKSRGGIETSTMNYYRNLNHDKIQYDFINPYDEFYYRDEIQSLGGKVYDVTNFRKNIFKYMLEVRSIIRSGGYSIVNIPMLSAINLLPIITAYISGVRNIIVHSHNTKAGSSLKTLIHKVNKPIVNIIAKYGWACSADASKWMFYKKAQLINNAINLETYEYDTSKRLRIRQELSIRDKFVVGNVARLVPEKNHDFLIDVFAEFITRRKNSILLIIGDGPYLDALKAKVEALGLESSVIFTGDRPDVSDFYSAMDVFVLTSKFEGLPMVGIEAQAAGLPVLCSDTVTEQMNVSGNIKYLSIEGPIDIWCDQLGKSARISNQLSRQRLTDSGYSIQEESKKVEKLYNEIPL